MATTPGGSCRCITYPPLVAAGCDRQIRELSAAGIQIFMVFEDSGKPELTVDKGRSDGQLALGQARAQRLGRAIAGGLQLLEFDSFTLVIFDG